MFSRPITQVPLQPVRFQLSHASAKGKLGQEHSIWISDLTPDVTEKQLERAFGTRFDSLKAVKSKFKLCVRIC